MKKKNVKVTFVLTYVIMSWLTVFFIGKRSFFRFLPVASFTNLFISVFSYIANKYKWWKTKNPVSPGYVDFTYTLGPYFLATLWIFKLTFGNFPKYLITNMVLNIIHSFGFVKIAEKVGVFKLNIKHTTWYFICIALSIIIYGYQYVVEQTIKNSKIEKDHIRTT